MPYPEQMVAPMRAELTSAGVQELRTPDEVESFFAQNSGTALVLVNSVCGCAAGSARPALKSAIGQDTGPDRVATVFAGQDLEATARARELFGDVPPSSPSMALLKDGELVHFLPRHMIEGRDAMSIATDLTAAFAEFC
ncbi:MAG: BrxA/BrxB family bacilliredoxin [Candidatus Krumholzibacteria bacterium]|nr:BrxA/BrxB family bacilliredoxin [Candidatus Krumholzibacteria bacterium]